METKLKQEPVADGTSQEDAMEIKESPLKTLAKLLEGVAIPVITCPDCHQRLSCGEHVCPVRPDLWQWQSAAPPEDKDATPEPVADGGGLPELPATTDPFETLRNTARWCMAASQQDWEDDLIDIKTAASGAPKTILALFAQLASSQEALRAAHDAMKNAEAHEILAQATAESLRERMQQAVAELEPCVSHYLNQPVRTGITKAVSLLSPEGSSR